jgi:hypothetical protein
MNVNTTKLIPLLDNCSGTAWKIKFKNAWNECDVWCEYTKYYYYASYIAQVYIIKAPNIPKGAKLKFPFPVKTYDTQLFSEYNFNNVSRKPDANKDFIVSDEFTTANDISSKELYFYLTSDVKLPQSFIFNKYRTLLFNFDASLIVSGEIKISRIRNLQTEGIINISGNAVAISRCYCWGDWDTWSDYDNWEEV